MRPVLSVVPGLLSALVLLSLLVPKRGWSEIPTRVRAVATGERRYVYGPPYGGRAAGGSRVRTLLRGLVGEIAHLVEMGLPLFVVALATERLGHHRRAAARQRWETSSSNLYSLIKMRFNRSSFSFRWTSSPTTPPSAMTAPPIPPNRNSPPPSF